MSLRRPVHDVLIVGGGPAGLSAALLLGRCRRRVLVCDAGEPRNRVTREVHGFLTRDPVPPATLRRIARAQLRHYDVTIRDAKVVKVKRARSGFAATLADGALVHARKVLLATGVRDRLPDVPGLRALYGRSVFHCPYCDGWEVRDQPLAALGAGECGVALAHELRGWSDDVVLCTNGEPLGDAARALDGIPVVEARIRKLVGRRGRLERIVFEDGQVLARRALFVLQDIEVPVPLHKLGETDEDGCIVTDKLHRTRVPGIWVAGDAVRDVRFAIVAAAEGAKAGFAINEALLAEDRKERHRGARRAA